MYIEKGDLVKLSYIGKLENGEIFDTSIEEIAKENNIYSPERDYGPISVVAGTGQIIEGLDKALLGMKMGEKKTLRIVPEEAFGERVPELVQRIPIEIFKENEIEPKEGMQVNTSYGIARITKIEENEVELDFNHPLAGKTVIFEIEIKDIIKK